MTCGWNGVVLMSDASERETESIPSATKNLHRNLIPFFLRLILTSMDLASSPNRTSKVNRGSGDGHRNYEGSSSYIQKTVCLHEWWLTEAESEFDGKRLAVAGSVSGGREPVRVFTSAPIVKRYDAFTLETADGVCVVFRGVINKSRTEENGFSSEVFNHFTFGFPYHWEECAQKCLVKEFRTGTESRGISDFTVPATG
ncbi:hypothetical protein SLEP1_g17765 [Rubroshorea leprosula]|nr:hypothetical protein SLEP1_g17765 [Rubroshorea leprosula]